MSDTDNIVTDLASETPEAAQPQAWSPPLVHGPRINRRFRPTLGELEEIEKIAWDEGHQKGYAAGLNAAKQEINQRMGEIDQQMRALDEQAKAYTELMQALAAPLEQLDEEMESQLVSLSTAIARQLVHRELTIDPSQVFVAVRKTVGLLPLAQRRVSVHLHPHDAVIVRERMVDASHSKELLWTLVDDPFMTRGGCRVVTDSSQVDASIETRLKDVLKHLLHEGGGDITGEATLTSVDDVQKGQA